MKDPLEEQDNASTPLTEEEREELIPSYITLRPELNEAGKKGGKRGLTPLFAIIPRAHYSEEGGLTPFFRRVHIYKCDFQSDLMR